MHETLKRQKMVLRPRARINTALATIQATIADASDSDNITQLRLKVEQVAQQLEQLEEFLGTKADDDMSEACVVRSHPRQIKVDGQWAMNTEKTGEFIRLHLPDGKNYDWSGDIEDYDIDATDLRPENEARWVQS
jgi:hypothetical protein